MTQSKIDLDIKKIPGVGKTRIPLSLEESSQKRKLLLQKTMKILIKAFFRLEKTPTSSERDTRSRKNTHKVQKVSWGSYLFDLPL